jgi:hypothetical protein
MALRNQLRSPGAFSWLAVQDLSERDAKAVADVLLGLPSPEAASFLLKHVQRFPESRDQLLTDLRHVARYAPEAELNAFPKIAREHFANDLETQFALFKSLQNGLARRGATLSDGLRGWAAELAEQLLAAGHDATTPWVNVPLTGAPTANPWFLQKRKSADGDDASIFLCSLPPEGEKLTGVLRSRPFVIPPKLGFHLAGHDGFPDQPPGRKNFVRLVAADTHEVLASAAHHRHAMTSPSG